MSETIFINAIVCKKCNDILVSTHQHDFKFCKCGKVSVDGGQDYCKRGFSKDLDEYAELSVTNPYDKCEDIHQAMDIFVGRINLYFNSKKVK